MVIAHRGSQNIESWLTDIVTVVQLKPDTFVSKAIELLKHEKVKASHEKVKASHEKVKASHEKVKASHEKGYRVSTTGHSLGGFLAQICVYWSHRRDFPETYYPGMNAMVFDSPGALDFLETVHKGSAKAAIKLEELNIHNFCATPTIVSTYGRHIGKIWHISKDASAGFFDVDFFTSHSLKVTLAEFNPETGEPYYFRAMSDWPQADYSQFKDLFPTPVNIIQVSSDIGSVLDFLNKFYQFVKSRAGYSTKPQTWYEKIFSERQGEITFYLEETKKGRTPSLDDFNRRLELALNAHYAAFPSENDSMKRLDIHHFDQPVQRFLIELEESEVSGYTRLAAQIKWPDKLKDRYGITAYINLLQQYKIEQQGDKVEVVVFDTYKYKGRNGSVFSFQYELLESTTFSDQSTTNFQAMLKPRSILMYY